ncbi:iron-containing alcohol dehydrogenase [Enterocloster aldenensis]|uniref:iron-containing alcohol dehydrogenase n=1 Tax=Enterocloster aldenensis TaxID=358742 RepID=UPI000E4CC1F1|nr:iron-containing alcohol dehydrogenase [Enterocloster aldenensis]
MNNFEYYNPVKIIYGQGEVVRIGQAARDYGRKALIVSYDRVDFYGNLFERIHGQLKESGIDYVDCFIATANPKISEARYGVDLGRKEQVDMVIGVGGGSAMDLSKVIAAGILYPYEDIRKMIRFSHSKDDQVPPREALPMIMVPTLPATASEMNPTAVITDDGTQRKSYVWAPCCLYPKVSILDPELTATLPAYQTACGGIDAISHVVEPFFFSDEATFGNIQLQDHMQIGVIKAIYENLPRVLKDPSDMQLRGLMQFAATVGLNGWLICGVQGWTPMHQMGHVLSSHFGATHGATLACMMLSWMRYFSGKEQNARFVKFARLMFGTEDLLQAADLFEEYIKSVGVPTRISEFGCTRDDLETLTQGVVDVSFGADGTLASIPPITREEAYRIYELSL